ncbi:hypothetical protein [Cellulosimicrobium sp. ES-005]|uniref:Uncharacterized protein n=1 Tax=Cellulosimicrobium sp. ES-005 TaxID=3163031 RepID=A0AAU8FV49_9MICO
MPVAREGSSERSQGEARPERLELYKLAYAESSRALEFQLKQLEGVRQRTVQYLAFVGTATAFLVGTSLSGSTRDTLFFIVAALGTLIAIASVVLAAHILLLAALRWGLPRFQWSFAMSGKRLVEWIEPQVGAPNEVDYIRALTLLNDEAYESNESSLQSLHRSFSTFVVLGFVQLSVWVVLAWLRG